MPKLLLWIIGYGLLLIGGDATSRLSSIKLGLDGRTVICGWLGGTIMIAAGLAAVQGRRSLRLSGLYVAIFLPLVLTAFFTWDAAAEWRHIRATGSSMVSGVCLSALAIISAVLVGVVSRLRPREGIASRGYVVPIPAPAKRQSFADTTLPHRPQPRHSEAS